MKTYTPTPRSMIQSVGFAQLLKASILPNILPIFPRVAECAWESSEPLYLHQGPYLLEFFFLNNILILPHSMAYAEFYMTLARIVLTYDMELYDTTHEDVELYHARIVGYPKKSSNPTRGQIIVKVKGKRAFPNAV